ncbi:monovalent cation/H+ antiporter complex subunit F [Pseudonocardia phyllosphaerae]|uniref:monovalent cation/H+ antiporter complex subunit F n=1 Tax=Pseudonocardia phyllosphaerae TaxID=3390502 RepID=UPI003978267C
MTVVYTLVLVMLAAAAVLTLWRLLGGPTTLDRIAALDVFVVVVVAASAVYAAVYSDGSTIPLIVAVALVALVGSATAARLVERWERHR